ncbi:MAG: substrate-binding domain-containing protein [Chitinophagales bacterium]|nr:substrate-binding domain-containing protein [Chitinophagales bacterium]
MNISQPVAHCLYLLAVIILLASCNRNSKNSPTDTPTSGEISISADETFEPIIRNVITNFQRVYTNAKIIASYKAETEVINDLLNDKSRVIVIARPLNSDEMNYFHQRQFEPRQNKIATDAVCFIINTNNPDTNLSQSKVRDIMSGKQRLWSEIDPNSSLKDISIVFDNNSSSIVRYIKDSINGSGQLPLNTYAAASNAAVVDYVEKNPAAIGVIGVNWISQGDDSIANNFLRRIKPVAIGSANPSDTNFYKPFQYYIMQHQYPFLRDVYVISGEPRMGLGTGFASYLASDEGQRIILRSGLMPATQPVRVIELRKGF